MISRKGVGKTPLERPQNSRTHVRFILSLPSTPSAFNTYRLILLVAQRDAVLSIPSPQFIHQRFQLFLLLTIMNIISVASF